MLRVANTADCPSVSINNSTYDLEATSYEVRFIYDSSSAGLEHIQGSWHLEASLEWRVTAMKYFTRG
jgi:hypothetical protein